MASLDVLLLQETKVDEETLLSLSKMKWKNNIGIIVSARVHLEDLQPFGQRICFLWKIHLKPNSGYLLKSDILQVKFLCLFLIFMFL